jgi:hypothetical protein
MPAAFGGAERDKRNERLEEQRARAAAEAERQRREAREKAEADRALARRMDFSNTEEYPSLGGSRSETARAPTKVKPALDFRAGAERGAILGAMQEAEAAAAAKQHAFASYVERMEAEERAAHRRRLAKITTRCFDDGFDEYEPPDEEEDYGSSGAAGAGYDGEEMPAYEDDDEDVAAATAEGKAEGEFNSHLAVIRRRGDKSDW